MTPLWHVTIATSGRRTAWTSRTVLLSTVRVITEVGGEVLLFFGVVDNHLHLVLVGDAKTVRARVGGIVHALRSRLGLELELRRTRPVNGVRHLENAVGYCLDQPTHHGISTGPTAAIEATALPDVLGARRLRGFDAGGLWRQLPRLREDRLLARVGLRAVEPVEVPEATLTQMVDAACAAVGRVEIDGRAREVVRARHAVVTLATRSGITLAAVRDALGLGRSNAYELVAREAPEPWLRAVGLQLALRGVPDRAAAKASPEPPRDEWPHQVMRGV